MLVLFDLYHAFDTPPKSSLIHALILYGVPEALLRLLTSAILTATTKIQGTDTTFSTNCRVKQGYPLSPLLFIVYYDILLRKVQKQHVPVAAFIDDLTAVLPLSRLKDLFPTILDIIKASGMAPNVHKTEILPIRVFVDRAESMLQKLEARPNMKTSVLHLGHPMHASMPPSSVFAIVQAELKAQLTVYHGHPLPTRHRVHLVNVVIMPALLYRVQLLPLEAYQKVALEKRLSDFCMAVAGIPLILSNKQCTPPKNRVWPCSSSPRDMFLECSTSSLGPPPCWTSPRSETNPSPPSRYFSKW